MVEHTSEQRRLGRPREGDDLARTVRETECDREVHEQRPGIREVSEVRGSVEQRLEAALQDLGAREAREASVSRKLEEAFNDLRRSEQKRESTETRLIEALECLKDSEKHVQVTLEETVQTDWLQAQDCRKKSGPEEPGPGEAKWETARRAVEAKGDSATNQGHHTGVSEVDVQAKGADLEKGSPRRFGDICTRNEFDEALAYHPELELRSNFESRYEGVARYYSAGESGIEACKPELVIALENLEVRRIYEEANGGPPEVRIESMRDVDELINKHSGNISVSEKIYTNAETYFKVRNESGKSQHQLAAEYGLSRTKISDIRRGVETKLIKYLRMREEDCILREWADAQSHAEASRGDSEQRETKELRLSVKRSAIQRATPELVKGSFTTIRESDRVDRRSVEDAIERIIQVPASIANSVTMVDLRHAGIGSQRMTEVRQIAGSSKTEIETYLRERLGADEVRIGIINDRLYIWTPDMTPNDMLNAWRTQYFYLGSHDMSRIVDTVGAHMNLGDTRLEKLRNLNELMHQMIHVETLSDAFKIQGSHSRAPGEAMHLVCDALGIERSQLEGSVKKVTGINGHGGIENARFPEGRKLEELRARLIATALSDCHIRLDDSIVEYFEENIQRLEQLVNQTLREFGDFTNKPKYVAEDGVYKLRIQSPYGRALNEWGVPSGDKAILNPNLPDEANMWSIQSIIAYHEDMIAQEGHVSLGRVSWNRSNTLDDGIKSERYDSAKQVSEEEVRLIQSKGNDYHGLPSGAKALLWTTIKSLSKSTESEESDAARALHDRVLRNHNNLMDDEKRIAEKLGVELSMRPLHVICYPESGRVSVKWETRTSNHAAALRWGLVCPPNHPEKREELKNWIIAQNPETVKRIVREVEDAGLPVHSIWRNQCR